MTINPKPINHRSTGPLLPKPYGQLSLMVAGLMALLWLLTGAGKFWPIWVWFGIAQIYGTCWLIAWTRQELEVAAREWRLHLALAAWLITTAVAVWLLSGRQSQWPAWPIVAALGSLGVHRLLRDPSVNGRELELSERVQELTRTRQGTVDAQAQQLRQIERDLHDGAQARLVALNMQIGRAEARLGSDADPQTLQLLRDAKNEASAAIAELRDLARGIAPPILADRGLLAAIEAVGKRSSIPVQVTGDMAVRPPLAVESAAYFVASEAITNAIKHATASQIDVNVAGSAERLMIEVSDDGIGGANPEGSGLSGLRNRVQALDGTLTVSERQPTGTKVRMELPCG